MAMILSILSDAVKMAYAITGDPDGYPGKVFNRWLSDVMGKDIAVPWSEFL